jgi:hypothetical protein
MMKSILKVFGISVAVLTIASPVALAKVATAETRGGSTEPPTVFPLPKASILADSVVVTGQQPAAAPAPALVVQPAQPMAQPVVVEPGRSRSTIVEHEDHNFMSTIAVSAIMGAVAGVLIGGAIYYLDGRDHPDRIGIWAAGGVLVGTGVGLTQVMVQNSRVNEAAVTRFPSDPVPTFRLALFQSRF